MPMNLLPLAFAEQNGNERTQRTAHMTRICFWFFYYFFATKTLFIARSASHRNGALIIFLSTAPFSLIKVHTYLASVITVVKDGLVRLRRIRVVEFIHCRVSIYIFRLPSDKISRLGICRHDACLSHNFFATLVIVDIREQHTIFNMFHGEGWLWFLHPSISIISYFTTNGNTGRGRGFIAGLSLIEYIVKLNSLGALM